MQAEHATSEAETIAGTVGVATGRADTVLLGSWDVHEDTPTKIKERVLYH